MMKGDYITLQTIERDNLPRCHTSRCYHNCDFDAEGCLRSAVYHLGYFEDQLLMSVLRSEYLKSGRS